jgi:predicted acyl esterase
MVYTVAALLVACVLFLPTASQAINHPTSNPYETRPSADGFLPYLILPIPDGLKIEKDVMIPMPDGIKLASNVVRPDKPGKFAVVLAVTPYGKDHTPPIYNKDGSPLPGAYPPFILRVHAHGEDIGHMKISPLTSWEAPDPVFWATKDYAVVVVDQRGSFKSEGKDWNPFKNGEDINNIVEWIAAQEWSNGKVGMIGVSALASCQYYAASQHSVSPHLKAIIPWESQTDRYRDLTFWGGIPETNFSRSLGPFKDNLRKMPLDQAAKVWAKAMDPVANQDMMKGNPKIELITIPTLLCASWSDKGLHTRGTFEAYRRIPSKEKWLYTHGGSKWERFYSQDALDYQKKFFDHYLKGVENGWQDTPRVHLEIRETRDEYQVRNENEFPLARTQYKRLYLDAGNGSLSAKTSKNERKIAYHSTQGGSVSFGYTFDEDTELTGYMKVKLWVAAKKAEDMDLFVTVRKFAGPYDPRSEIGKPLDAVLGKEAVARGNEIYFRGMNGHAFDMAARGQMRVSQRDLDMKLSTPYQPVQKFQGEKKLKPGEIVPVEIALLPSSTLFRKGESMSLTIQGYCPVENPLVWYDWLINKGDHIIYTGGKHDSYLQIPVIPAKK